MDILATTSEGELDLQMQDRWALDHVRRGDGFLAHAIREVCYTVTAH